MSGVWAFSLLIRNAGIVDVAWAAMFAPVMWLYAYAASCGEFGIRHALLASMVTIWSFRLAMHLLIRVWALHPKEDGRYVELRRQWGARASSRFFWFFQAQAVLVSVLSVPFLIACRNPAPSVSAVEILGFGIWVVGVAGETLADRQLARFKSDPAGQLTPRVCDTGLWRYSRHPNYFFEWLIWVSYFLFALGSPFGFAAIVAPLLMLYFLCRVTGIPATEQHAVQKYGEAYRAYQKTTRAFVPWFRKPT